MHNSGGLENGDLGPGGCQVNLTRMGGIGVAVAASLATIAAGLAPAAARAPAPGSRAALAVRYYTGVRGVARLVPRHTRVPGHTPAHGAPARLIEKGARLLPSGAFSAAEAVPRAPASAAAAAATATPLANFNGVSSRDSQVTNYNQETEPPDQGLCEGHGFVLEVVNSAYRVYKTTGTTVIGPFHMNDLFNVGGKAYTSDPRCWFDPATQTWFATVLFINNGGLGTKSALLIAVRHSPNPLGLWNEYSINTTDIANGCPCVGDQPRIGVDQYNLYVTDDEVSIKGQQGRGAEVWAFDKDELIAGATTLHFVRFPYLNTLAPQPALSTGTPNAEYFLSSLDFNGQGDHRIGVWAMTGRNHVGQGGIGMPVLTSTIISTESYAPPPPAPQKGNPQLPINPDDGRMQQASFAGGTVWGELTTAVQPAGDNAVRAGGAWFQVKPTLGARGITGASIVRQGYIDAPGRYLIYPAVQPDPAGNAAVVFTETSRAMFPAAAFATLRAGAGNFGPPALAAAGNGPYRQGGRWGDYSFAVPDDTSDAAWLATEYIPPKSSQTTNRAANWGTRVIEVPLR